MKNKTIVIMGGGTSGWVSALYFLNKNRDLNLNLDIKIISSNDIEPIGVGEGTTMPFKNFIENTCKIDKKQFLKETKGSFKYGIKFKNWNFDNEHYYHLFTTRSPFDGEMSIEKYLFYQYAINENLNVPQKLLQKKFFGIIYDIIDENKIDFNHVPNYAYHFSSDLIISFLKRKCLEFNYEFKHIIGNIMHINYDNRGFIQKLDLDNNQSIYGDFFINCLGFKSKDLINNEYFDMQNWDNYILNNSAFAIQVKNHPTQIIEPYTTSTAQEYGWSWKIPQYEKTGYGYVYSDHFINDEDKLYDDLLKTYNIKKQDVFKTRIVKSKPYYNKKQLHKNCLSLGLSSGFIEPLEATSIEMTIISLTKFFYILTELNDNNLNFNDKYNNIFNESLSKHWINTFRFIIFHYFSNNAINDYWQHYKNLQKNIDLYERHFKFDLDTYFPMSSYNSICLGLKQKDFNYTFSNEKYLKENIHNYLKVQNIIDINLLKSHNDVLNEINLNYKISNSKYL